MVAAIDGKHGFDFFKGFKASSWNEQSDFTHTGKLQIGSRLTIAAMMVAVLLLKTHNRTSDGERLEDALMQFGTPHVDRPG